MYGAFLVSGQDVLYLILLIVELVIDIYDHSARKTEHGINTLFYQGLDKYLCSGHLHLVIPRLRLFKGF